MKKKIIIIIAFILVGILTCAVWVDIISIKVENELKALKDYSKLCASQDFEWEKKDYFLFHEYRFECLTNEYYDVFPTGGDYVSTAVKFSTEEYSNFPEDLLKEQYSYEDFYLPESEYSQKKWEKSGTLKISFDKEYKLEESEKYLDFGKIKWLWIDTYSANIEGPVSKNNVFGIPIDDKIENSMEQIEEFIAILNKYGADESSDIGRKIYNIRRNIKETDTITVDDLRVIGCVIYLNEDDKEKIKEYDMFKVVN